MPSILAYVTLAESTVIEGRAVQRLNAEMPMLVTPAGIVTLVRLVHELNAEPPILVTLAGIVTLVRPVHELNAELPMLVTVAGMTTAPAFPAGH
jgi:hypothetical protein